MSSSPAASEDPALVRKLVANHRELLGFLERRLGDRALAEDILQDAFVRGLDKLGTLDKDESALAWFYRLLRNAVVDHHRRRTARDKKLEAFAKELAVLTEPEADVERAVCGCVSRLAETLKPEYSEVLRRVELDGVALKDYAAEIGISSGNAAVRLFRAREALRKQVSRSCGTCAEHGCLDCTCGEKTSRGCQKK